MKLIKKVLVSSLIIQFLLMSNYCKASGFGWYLVEVDYKAIETFSEVASPERIESIIKELNDFYLIELVGDNERILHRKMIDEIFTNGIHYDRLSFNEAMAVDRIFRFLFSAESPIPEIIIEDQGFYVPTYCMKDITESTSSQMKVIPLLKRGRRYRTKESIECNEGSFNLRKQLDSLKRKKLSEDARKKVAEIVSNLNQKEGENPCYYSYLLLSPKEVKELNLELKKIKRKIDFSHDDECYFEDFFNSISRIAENKSGLFLYTLD